MRKLTLKGKPQERQKLFFDAKEKYVAYGGARGGGKSWALRRKMILMCLKYPGLSVLILRRTYAELRENHIRPLCAELAGTAVYTETRKTFEFPNGSRIRMGYCDSEADVNQYQGQEFDVIALDEATQLTEYQFQTLKGALRGANPYPKRMYLTCNPGGVGHGWVKRLFIDREYREGEDPKDYCFATRGCTANGTCSRGSISTHLTRRCTSSRPFRPTEALCAIARSITGWICWRRCLSRSMRTGAPLFTTRYITAD